MRIQFSADDFVAETSLYIHRLLKGICEHSFKIAAQRTPHGIRFVAKLNEKDFETVKYSDLYGSVQKIVARVGALRRDPSGQPFDAEFKLFDPYFEGLDYHEIQEPASSRT